jgi:hypothetical protein
MLGIPQLTAAVKELAAGQRALIAAVYELTKEIRRLQGPPSPTKGFTLTLLREDEHMPTFNVYEASIPEATGPNSADVVAGRIKIQLDGVDQPSVDTPKGPATAVVKLKQGPTAKVSFVHVDDAGNESANPLALPEFTVADTIPPPDAVDGFALVATGEVTE